MKFEKYLVNENMVFKALKVLMNVDFKKAKKILEDEFDRFVNVVQSTGLEPEVVSLVNRKFGLRLNSLNDVKRLRLRESDEMVNEDLEHWWKTVKSEGFPTLAFYPALTVWLELDKLFQGQDVNMTKTIVYSLFWILLVSGKYIKGWMDWKKQNPDEYSKERAMGKGGIV